MKTVSFFGHGEIFYKEKVKDRLEKTIEELKGQGYNDFLIGCHGDFDGLALSSCLKYRKEVDKDVKIHIVLTSLSFINKDKEGNSFVDFYMEKDCELVFYEIERVYYKNRITFSNKKMVDNSDLIICYVDMSKYKSGAKSAIKYALKQNKEIINLFNEEDRCVDLSAFYQHFNE